MKLPYLLLLMVFWNPVLANHANDFGIDICVRYEDRLPPGLLPQHLPEPNSQGAALLASYCTQCHNLPAPDRHTAAEWQDLLPKMLMLMDVSHRFGGIMGRVRAMSPEQQAALAAYLQQHSGEIQRQPQTPDTPSWKNAAIALLPFVLLVVPGLLRWGRKGRHA